MKYIEQAFASFKKKVLDPLNLPDNHVQIIEMRRAFYCGAIDMFMLVNQLTELPQEQAIKELDSIAGEKLEFYLEIFKEIQE